MIDTSGPPRVDLTDEFRHRLLDARRSLRQTLAETDDELATLEPHQAGGFVEDAASTEAASLLSRLEDRHQRELDEIDEALGRLAAGRFGFCERCGQAIGLGRLRAVPAARHCAGCQGKEELR